MAEFSEKDAAWQKDAAAVARSFLMLFNGTLLYGCAHPNTAKNAESFCTLINGSFGGAWDMLTVISNNGTLMIEDWPLDAATFNTRKVILHFEKLGLISLSFERGVTVSDLIRLIGFAGDIHNIERGKAGLEEAKRAGSIPHIRINYVQYGKIKADEIIIKDTPGARVGAALNEPEVLEDVIMSNISALSGVMGMGGESSISTGKLSAAAAAQIEEVFTLSSLIERPKEVSSALANADANGMAGVLGNLKSEIAGSGHSADELLESLFTLKQDLYEAIQVQKATGGIMRSAEAVEGELNDLTCAAIVKLARDEYKSGKTPIKRLAHAIRRMLPNNTELMRVLPGLKEMLLSEGMSLTDYLELVRMLGLEIESETLSDTLKDAADSVGATVNDLVAAIREKPEETARLILLASEVRGAGADAERLSEMLTGYIEEVSSKLAADTNACDDLTLKKTLAKFESQMFGQLSGDKSIPESVLANVRDRLAARFEEVFTNVSEDVLKNNPAQTTAQPTQSGATQAPAQTTTPTQTTAQPALSGATQAPAQSNSAQAPPQQVQGHALLPEAALSAGNLLFLINKEISRHARYKTPFATVLISVEKIDDGNVIRDPQASDAAELLPPLFDLVLGVLRDVDMTGTLAADPLPELFAMLPMTDEKGAETVRGRIAKKISASKFKLSDKQVRIAAKVSATCPDEVTKTLKAFMTKVRQRHKQ